MNNGECFYTVQTRYASDADWSSVFIAKTSREALEEYGKHSIYAQRRILQTTVVWPMREPFRFNIQPPRDSFAFFLIERQAFATECVAKCKNEWNSMSAETKKKYEELAKDDMSRYWREYAEEFHSATS